MKNKKNDTPTYISRDHEVWKDEVEKDRFGRLAFFFIIGSIVGCFLIAGIYKI